MHWQCHPCIEIYVDSVGSILLGYQELSSKELTDTLPYLILNPDYIPYLPPKEQVINSDSVVIAVPKTAIDILTSPVVSKEKYSEVIYSVLEGFMEIRNRLSEFFYQKEYNRLSENQQSKIDEYIPMHIRFERAPNEDIKSEIYEMDKSLFGGY